MASDSSHSHSHTHRPEESATLMLQCSSLVRPVMCKSHDYHMILTCNVPLTLESRGGSDSDFEPAGGGMAGPIRRGFFFPPTVKEMKYVVEWRTTLKWGDNGLRTFSLRYLKIQYPLCLIPDLTLLPLIACNLTGHCRRLSHENSQWSHD